MSRFWPAQERSQLEYETLRDQVLAGEEASDLATLRFRRSGLAALITIPDDPAQLVAHAVGSQRPRWSGLEDPRLDALAATYTLLSQLLDSDSAESSWVSGLASMGVERR